MSKKFLAIVLLLCVVMMPFAGCGDTTTTTISSDLIITSGDSSSSGTDDTKASDEQSSGTNGSQTVQQNIKNPLEVNLGGAEITIYSVDKDAFNTSAKASTKSDQSRIDMLKKLEKKINCKIVNKYVSASQIQTQAFATISSGKSLSHLILTNAYMSAGLVSNKTVENIKNVPTMDVTKDYLNVGGAVEASTYGGGTWYVAEPIKIYTLAQGIFFNKRVLNEIGAKDTDLYKLVTNKQWTVGKLRDLAAKAVKDLDGKPGMTGEDRWGITYIDAASSFAPTILEACGVKMLVTDQSGKIKYNMESPEVINAINLANDIVKSNYSLLKDGKDDDAIKQFTSGRSLFLYGPVFYVSKLSDMEDDFGFLPFPSNKSDGNYNSAVNWNTSVLMIPKNLSAKELKNAGSFLQAYCYLANDVNTSVKEDYTARYFRDDESGENFALAAKMQKLTVAQSISNTNEAILTGTYRVIWNLIGKNTAASTGIQSSKSAAVLAIDELMKKIKK